MKVVTHNGIFHADEVLAIALLQEFSGDNTYSITRTRDENTISNSDIAIDVGGVYNEGTKNTTSIKHGQFDHHQRDYTGTLSSAGMVWEALKRSGYPAIDDLVHEVDEQDNGIIRHTANHFSNIVSVFNSLAEDIDDNNEAFNQALSFAKQYVHALRVKEDNERALKKEALSTSKLVSDSGVNFLVLGNFCPANLLTGEADFMVSYDYVQKCYSVQQVPLKDGEFGGKYKLLPTLHFTEVFTHKGGFIGKYKTSTEISMDFLYINVEGVGEIKLQIGESYCV